MHPTRKIDWSERGSAAIDAGDLATAEQCFRQAVKADKGNARHRFHLALVLEARADFGGAAEQLTAALRVDPRAGDAARRLTSLISRHALPESAELDATGLRAALRHDSATPELIAKLALRHLATRGCLRLPLGRGRQEGWAAAARGLCLTRTADALRDELLLELLSGSILTDPDVERLLTALRRALLLELPAQRFADRDLVRFVVAMLHQCRANGYVWWTSGEELAAIRQPLPNTDLLRGDLEAGRKFLLASLYQDFRVTLGQQLEPQAVHGVRPKALREALAEHLAEDCDLRERAARMPRLGAIGDATSREVAGQYERNPYPRWTRLRVPSAGEFRQRLGRYFKPEELAFMDQPFNVLIAGCGTGQQAVRSALGYAGNAHVTALDLSISSLAYASRMGERYGVRNLELAQADLQAIDALGPPILPRFHIIECTGVLHHMADPMDGWRKLLTCLAPGGLMLVGLYSATARRELTALRADPAYPGPGCEDAALRDFRRALMDRPRGELGSSLQDSLDFYTNSDFRDLACHVSERCLTLVEIKQFLDQNDLAFRGFSLDPAILQSFAERYPDDRWPGSLQRWQEFEAENPHTFDAMYVFWCARA